MISYLDIVFSRRSAGQAVGTAVPGASRAGVAAPRGRGEPHQVRPPAASAPASMGAAAATAAAGGEPSARGPPRAAAATAAVPAEPAGPIPVPAGPARAGMGPARHERASLGPAGRAGADMEPVSRSRRRHVAGHRRGGPGHFLPPGDSGEGGGGSGIRKAADSRHSPPA
jgi:hypothetical protein